jgi:general secretion pathway protein H
MLNAEEYRKRNTGFTLLELIIVLFLITLILGLSAVMFANFLPSSRFDSTVRNISATIKYARSLAHINGEFQTVLIDLDAKTFGIEGRGSKDIPSDVNIKIIDPFAGEVEEGEYRFILYPGGGVEGGTVELWNAKKSARIELEPIAGTLIIK